MKNTTAAVGSLRALEEQLRTLENELEQSRKSLHRLEQQAARVRDTATTLVGRYRDDKDILDLSLELDQLERRLANVSLPSLAETSTLALDIASERITELSNYAANQSELEQFLREKRNRGESINSYLVSGSYTLRRAAKKVLREE